MLCFVEGEVLGVTLQDASRCTRHIGIRNMAYMIQYGSKKDQMQTCKEV